MVCEGFAVLERGDLKGGWDLSTVTMAVEVDEETSSERRGEWNSSSWESVSEIDRLLVAELLWRRWLLMKSMGN